MSTEQHGVTGTRRTDVPVDPPRSASRLKEDKMRLKKPTRAKKTEKPSGSFAVKTIFGVGVCVLGAAILIAARPPRLADTAVVDAHAEKPGAVDAYARKAAASKAAAVVAASTTEASAGKSAAGRAAPVTITGCLEKTDDAFRLKDATGDGAPKARSWKSGFLKKGSASIGVVDSANRLKLPTHVGQRVSVTGTLVDREMQVRSLQRVAASCSRNAGA
jgi:hypothetical protein